MSSPLCLGDARRSYCSRRYKRRKIAEMTEYLMAFLEETAGGGCVTYEGIRNERLVFRLVVPELEHLPLVAREFCQRCSGCLNCNEHNILVKGRSVKIQVPIRTRVPV